MKWLAFPCFGQLDRRDLAVFLRRGGWTNRTLEAFLFRRFGKGDRRGRRIKSMTARTLQAKTRSELAAGA